MSAAVDHGAVVDLLHRVLASQAHFLACVREVQVALEQIRQGQAEVAAQVRAVDRRTVVRAQPVGPVAMPVTAAERWLTPAEVSRRLGRHPDTVRADLRSGRLPGTRVGRSWRVRAVDLDRHLEADGAAEREDRGRVRDARKRFKERRAGTKAASLAARTEAPRREGDEQC